jgi:hypothetical protein
MEFKREWRYYVFKRSDVSACLDDREIIALNLIGEKMARHRHNCGKPPFNAVVVEADWPEFEMVWESIEHRTAEEQRHRVLEEKAETRREEWRQEMRQDAFGD